jgi:N-acetylmuramoyl-L-alanine amidase
MSARQKGLIVISAGHGGVNRNGLLDEGAIAHDRTTELMHIRTLTRLILDEIRKQDLGCPLIELSGSVETDREDLNLAQTIRWCNTITQGVSAKSLILDVHFNFNAPNARGCEVFYSANTNPVNQKRAADLSAIVSKVLGSPNRGAKPDTHSAVKYLGMLRQTTAQALLIEPAFLSAVDLPNYLSKKEAVAKAIAEFMIREWKLLNP